MDFRMDLKKTVVIFLIFVIAFVLLAASIPKNHGGGRVVECEDCNVVLIVIDAARQDHFGVYGYHRNTTPNIDRLAEKSFVFENAISQATWTKPSIASLFTSAYPTKHGVDRHIKTIDGGVASNILPGSYVTLAEALKADGYRTYGFVNNDFIGPELGFDQGFDRYWRIKSDLQVTRRVMKLIENHPNKFFFYIHYIGPHAEYRPPPEFRNVFVEEEHESVDLKGKHQDDFIRMNLSENQLGYVVSQYDGEIAFIDSEVRKILAGLDERGLTGDTIVIITSDHGEEFYDHDGAFGHGLDPYDVLIKVPLIIWVPTAVEESERMEDQVRLIDLMPTILDLTGLTLPAGLDGCSIKPALHGRDMNLKAYSERTVLYQGRMEKVLAVRYGGWKFMYDMGDGWGRLFNVGSDPYERKPVVGHDELKRRFREELLRYFEENSGVLDGGGGDFVVLSNDSVRRLYEVGYLS